MKNNTRRTGLICLAAAGAMLGLSFASVPLYRLFCQITGYGGQPQIQAVPYQTPAENAREVTIRFDASTANGLNWEFAPATEPVRLKLGESVTATYRARNRDPRPVSGSATFNVTPHKAAFYLNKIGCFCFQKQTLAAGEAADMKVIFSVSPAIEQNPEMSDVQTLTLSYTFHPLPEDG